MIWFQTGLTVTTSAALWTTATTGPLGGYERDLVITNGGPATLFAAFGAGVTSASTTSSFQVPSGGSVILTECQVPRGAVIYGVSAGTSSTDIGLCSQASYT